MLMLFKNYEGYSSSFVDITIPVESDCYGTNFLFSRLSESGLSSRYRQISMKWNDNMGGIHEKNSVSHCVDIWLLHNIISFDSGRSSFLNCTLYLDNNRLVYMELHGPVQLTISSSIIFPSLQYMDYQDAHYFMVKILADTLKDYPVNADVIGSNTSVNLMKPSVHMFSIISRIQFTVRHRAHDAPIFAIRMQFLTSHVCGSVLHNNFSDFYPLYMLRGDITTVALSSHFSYNKAFQLIFNKTGHIHGPCQLHVEGQSCSQCRCKKLNIIFQPYNLITDVIMTHKIDVSIKAKSSLTGCVLDIGIWEHFVMEGG